MSSAQIRRSEFLTEWPEKAVAAALSLKRFCTMYELAAANLRERLKQGALSHAKLDLEIAEEWFPVEQEAWQRLDREERAAKTSRGAAKSSSRHSTRR